MWEVTKELAGNVFGIVGIAWVLAHLVLIIIHGEVSLYERCPWILYGETVWTLGILALLAERLIMDIRAIARRRHSNQEE